MSDRRRRGEDEFADESPWPDDNPNDYRWAQDLAREAREEAREEARQEERRGRHSAVHRAQGDPYQQPPGSQSPQVPRPPAPRAPVDPRTGHPSGPMPTVPAETYSRGARRGGAPADPRTGHPSGPMPTVPAGSYDRGGVPADPRTGHAPGPVPTVPSETYDRDARRAGPPPAGRSPRDPLWRGQSGQDGGYPPERAGSGRSQGRQGSPPAGDDYGGGQSAAGGGRGRPGAGYAGPGDPYAGSPDPYDSPPGRRSRQDAPRGRRGGDQLGQAPGGPGGYPEPPGGRGRPDRYPDATAGRVDAPDSQQPAGPRDQRRRRGARGRPAGQPGDGWERDSEGRYVWAPDQPAGQRRGGRDDYAGPAGGRGGPSDPGRVAGGGYDDPAGQYGGRSARPGPGRIAGPGGGYDDPAGQYGGRSARPAPGPGGGYDDPAAGYHDDAAGGSGFFDGLREDGPAGPGRGRGRRGGGDGGWDDGRGRPKKRRGGRVGGLAAIVILLIIGTPLIVGGYFLYHAYEAHYNPPNYSGNGTGEIVFQVVPGDTAFSVANRLVTDGVVASARALELAAEKANNGGGLQPGFYRLHKHMSAAAAWALLVNPKARVQLTVTIPEGLRVSQILALLGKNSGIPLSAYESAVKNTSALGLPSYANNNPEGYLYPATYQIQPNATAVSVLKQMVAAFNQEAVGASLTQAARAVHLTPAQVIVVASLAQAEAGKNSDMPKIARVVYNRLQQGMPLDFDSTVLFALNTYGILASNQQLQVNSPYNTYTHKGLPPGPIDSPGNTAIQAALHPASGNWLYFVDVNPKIKDTVFTSSETQFEQLKAELEHNLGH